MNSGNPSVFEDFVDFSINFVQSFTRLAIQDQGKEKEPQPPQAPQTEKFNLSPEQISCSNNIIKITKELEQLKYSDAHDHSRDVSKDVSSFS